MARRRERSASRRCSEKNRSRCRFRGPSCDSCVEPRFGWLSPSGSPTLRFQSNGGMTVRCMIVVKADKNSEAGVLPDEQLLTEMEPYNEELAKAGVFLAAEG